MTDMDELKQRLKKDYQNYLRVKHLVESGGWYGDWYYWFKEMEEQRLEAFKSKVDEIMAKLGYENWTDEDVIKELIGKVSKVETNQSRTAKENGENNQ